MKTVNLFALKIAVCLSPWLAGVPLFAEEGDPPGRVARLSYLNGHVSLQPSGEDQWTDASTNHVVTTGDRLYTDQGSRAELEIGPFALHMQQTTDLTIVNLNDRILQVGLTQGSIRLTVFDLPPENSVEIDTPNGALTVLRAGWYRVNSDPNTSSMLVSVNSGSLQVNGEGVSQTVNGRQAVQLIGADPVQITSMSLPNQDEFDEWCAKRDERIRSFAAAQYVNRYIPGVEDLDDHGRWQVTADYGPVWFPAGVAVDWVPYRFGHWVWVEPWGWTWVEDEAWGFCPFHYGRWALIGSVWGWVPGPIAVAPIYGPAFVAFVGGAGFSIGVGVQAWFPLGPRDPFFPWYHCGREHLLQVNITNVRNVTNITNIINVTNINNIHYAYKEVATTAVPANVFRSGQPVAHSVIRVRPEQLTKAQVVPHPSVAPAREAVFGGRGPINPPPVRAARILAPPAAHGVQPAPFVGRSSAQRPAAGNTQALRTAPEPSPRVTTPSQRPSPPEVERPPFVTRTPPPHYNVPFTEREPALAEHPGRPLEPAQRQNLRAGRPAGSMADREFPPHPPGWKSVPPPRPAAPPARRQ
jgi:hypothetical protein